MAASGALVGFPALSDSRDAGIKVESPGKDHRPGIDFPHHYRLK
jgi:hypothetical protein